MGCSSRDRAARGRAHASDGAHRTRSPRRRPRSAAVKRGISTDGDETSAADSREKSPARRCVDDCSSRPARPDCPHGIRRQTEEDRDEGESSHLQCRGHRGRAVDEGGKQRSEDDVDLRIRQTDDGGTDQRSYTGAVRRVCESRVGRRCRDPTRRRDGCHPQCDEHRGSRVSHDLDDGGGLGDQRAEPEAMSSPAIEAPSAFPTALSRAAERPRARA